MVLPYCSLKCALALSLFKKSTVPALIESVGTMTINLKVKEGDFYSLTTYVHNSKNILLIEGTALIYKK